MSFTVMNTVGEIAIKLPGAIKVFEKFGIDYCCGGKRTLNEVCQAARLPVEEVISSLMQNERAAPIQPLHNWQAESLSSLVDYILQTHHVFTNQELVRLEKLLDKVCGAHAQNHPELLRLRDLFNILKNDLLPHMLKEEGVLFPYIRAIEAASAKRQKSPMPFFSTVRNPVRMMMMEHDNAGELLRIMRTITEHYSLPADACASFQALYDGLKAFEADLHQHIHLENNILFPRAIELEKIIQRELQTA